MKLFLIPLAVGLTALAITYAMAPTYTAKTTFVPPQQSQSAATSIVASLGALSSLAGVGGKTTADQYLSLLQSRNIADKIIDKFDLMKVYAAKYRFGARQTLAQDSRMSLGKKDGLITIEVDSESPQLAADLANQYVQELRRLVSELVLTEAQERRVFFEGQLKSTKAALSNAQQALQRSGFDAGALKAEPRAAAEGYAKIQAEITAAEIRMQTLRRMYSETSSEVQQQATLLNALSKQAIKLESSSGASPGEADYVATYRDYKYQESLFEIFSRQYEMARLDESREGAAIQVIDVAAIPEYKSKPKRGSIALSATLAAFVALLIGYVLAHWWRIALQHPGTGMKLRTLQRSLRIGRNRS